MRKTILMVVGLVGILVNGQVVAQEAPAYHTPVSDGKADKPRMHTPKPPAQPPDYYGGRVSSISKDEKEGETCHQRLKLYEKKIELLEAKIKQLEGK